MRVKRIENFTNILKYFKNLSENENLVLKPNVLGKKIFSKFSQTFKPFKKISLDYSTFSIISFLDNLYKDEKE